MITQNEEKMNTLLERLQKRIEALEYGTMEISLKIHDKKIVGGEVIREIPKLI